MSQAVSLCGVFIFIDAGSTRWTTKQRRGDAVIVEVAPRQSEFERIASRDAGLAIDLLGHALRVIEEERGAGRAE
ncbi:MAG: hypothetical protein U1F43_26210 [Myxococcota bacterium]